jgi:hypothetical protein
LGGKVVERCAAQCIKLKISLAEGTNHAVFGGGAGIDGQRQTRSGGEIVPVTIHLTRIAVPSGLILNTGGVER